MRKQKVIQEYVDVVLDLAGKWGKKSEGQTWRVESVDMCSGVLAAADKDGNLASYFTCVSPRAESFVVPRRADWIATACTSARRGTMFSGRSTAQRTGLGLEGPNRLSASRAIVSLAIAILARQS